MSQPLNEIKTHEPRKRWLVLLLVAIAEMLAISTWLISSAIGSELAQIWSLTPVQSGALTTAVQIGFVFGTLVSAVLNLADIVPNRWLFTASAILAAAANYALISCEGFWQALAMRFLVGVFMAGIYPPAMKMIATWFKSNRGFAIGSLVGALVLGKSIPFLLKALQISEWQSVVGWSSIASLIAAAIVGFTYSDGPFQFQRRPFSFSLIGEVMKHRATRLAIFGYLGHMWELYAMWAWIGPFLYAASARETWESQSLVNTITLLIFISGAIGCVAGGWFADRMGRPKVVNVSMLVSGICCIAIGLCFQAGFWVCAVIGLIWGAFVVADSAQFSTMVTEVSPQHAVGTALTIQTCLGFLLTTITIQMIPILEPMLSWTFAFSVLAIGPLFGIIAIKQFSKLSPSH